MTTRPPFTPVPVTLEGRLVRLEPLALRHVDDLARAGAAAEVWRYLDDAPLLDREAAERWVTAILETAPAARRLPFAIVLRDGDRAIGSTSYGDIRAEHRGLEIGWTWIAPAHQRTGVNTECKRLLLGHAFDALGAVRVQLKTDLRNERSQRAIERLGATREGVLRHHLVLRDGALRDTVMYSITDEEWPEVRRRLDAMMR